MAVLAPIWKDTFYEADVAELEYTLSLYDVDLGEESVIYAGRAYRLPSADTLKINISKICCNYLSCDIQELMVNTENIVKNKDAYREFRMRDTDGNLLQTYNFLYDWSYEEWDGTAGTRSHPINGHYADGMYKLYTYNNNGSSGVYTYKERGDYPVAACGDWAIYYLNSYGGWDAFLVEGNDVKMDSITQHNYNQSFDNTTLEYEQGRYISEITTSYEFHTGWLNDEQAKNLVKNLLGSNDVYIHDLKNNKVKPAIITDNKLTYKTYRNQGKQMVNYTINIKESQTKIRR